MELQELKELQFDLELTGFDIPEIDLLLPSDEQQELNATTSSSGASEERKKRAC